MKLFALLSLAFAHDVPMQIETIGAGYPISWSSKHDHCNPATNGWCPSTGASDNESDGWIEFFQVSFLRPSRVTTIELQGRNDSNGDQWVERYRIEITHDGANWLDMGEYEGTYDRDTVVSTETDMNALALRIIPL